MTDIPAPPPVERVADLIELLDLEDLGFDRFLGRRKKGGIGRVFGGQVVAQALCAAQNTVGKERPVHSLHAYFLRGGSEDHPIELRVERPFDGGSFSNRHVTAWQLDRPILTLSASFQKPRAGFAHQDAVMPKTPEPEGLPSDEEMRAELAREATGLRKQMLDVVWPIEMRQVDKSAWFAGQPGEPRLRSWFRCAAPLPDDPLLHRAVLAYASDLQLLGTSIIPHGNSWHKGGLATASLDHAIWFHADFRADEWLLYSMESPWAGDSRGYNRGQIFRADGTLVASVIQEGMIRQIETPTD
jgi:acyl-CoA thioesterase-2